MLAKKMYSSTADEQNSLYYERYALYFVPDSKSSLAEFGRSWFGTEIDQGQKAASKAATRNSFGLDEDLMCKITGKPGRYGLHATLKAPFHLSYNYNSTDLIERVESFASNRKAFEIPKLRLATERNFIALTPAARSVQIDQLASQCVLAFDEFRAPLSLAERARRLQANELSKHQRVMLETLGYPYVLSEFNFHITLTTKLTDMESRSVIAALDPVLEPLVSTPLHIDAIALVGDPGPNKPFEVIERFPLRAC